MADQRAGEYRKLERCAQRMAGFPRCGLTGSVEHECVVEAGHERHQRHQCGCGATWRSEIVVPDDEGSGGVW